MTNSPKIQYVDRLLEMNPLEQSAEILALRHAFLHPQSPSVKTIETHLDHFDRRELAVQQIQSLRIAFWSLKQPKLLQQLENIDVAEFPDLALGLSRLKKIAELKDSFERLQRHPDCFEEFYKPFCTLVVASPRTVNELRVSLLDASRRESTGFDFLVPADYSRAVRTIQREFPELYQLEKNWLNQMGQMTKQYKTINQTAKVLYFLIASTLGITILLSLMYIVKFLDVSYWS